jgi:hypothetical protein
VCMMLYTPTHKPDSIRLLEPRFIGYSNNKRRCSSIRKIQIGEWKYCTDYNLSHTAQLIRDKYNTPPANALLSHWSCTNIDILPIVMSRTGTLHTSTIISLTALLTLRTDPPDKPISKARLDTTRILSQIHLHTVEWLRHLFIYRLKSRTSTHRSSPHHNRT